ncbi:hypothetical protein MOV98_09095 [Acinetobacter variabilis]|nr:hypothetical protein MOV98_09095 [Acinetobacter variabilis]
MQLMISADSLYELNFSPLVMLSSKDDLIYAKLAELENYESRSNFPLKNQHAYTTATTYDSVRLPIYPGMKLSYSVASFAGAGQITEVSGSKELLLDSNKTITFNTLGNVVLSTYNNTHSSYNPDFIPTYQVVSKESEKEDIVVKQFISGSYLPTPTLKAVREITFTDKTQKTATQYLWHDNEGNFFVSSALRGDKKWIFKFDSNSFYGDQPHHFSMNFDKFGNIVCVFRIEHLDTTLHSDSVRKNPIILLKDENYRPVVVDFGSALKPSGWLQNCGFLCTNEYIMLTEYTRPSVATANTWKATYPLTSAANWKVAQSFALSPDWDTAEGVKHIHNIDRDPFTGFVYTSTGDYDAGAAIYMSKDNGETFTSILSGSEKYCRVLNWVFTKDWIYWATDSVGAKHGFFKAPRNELGEMDLTNITDILIFPSDVAATYATIYMPKINALVFLSRWDAQRTEVSIDLWDFKTQQLIRLDTIPSMEGLAVPVGFRCECFEWVPRGNEIACGFSQRLGTGVMKTESVF